MPVYLHFRADQTLSSDSVCCSLNPTKPIMDQWGMLTLDTDQGTPNIKNGSALVYVPLDMSVSRRPMTPCLIWVCHARARSIAMYKWPCGHLCQDEGCAVAHTRKPLSIPSVMPGYARDFSMISMMFPWSFRRHMIKASAHSLDTASKAWCTTPNHAAYTISWFSKLEELPVHEC